jgi:VanZ family protein
MSIFFRVLSAAYIAGIFLFADSPMVSDLTTFNPYSLLHIPLYGILTFLLILSFSPKRKIFVSATNSTDPSNSISPTNSRNLMVAGIIALVVAIADEIHQAYLPNRNASVIDVLLDLIGIVCCILLARRIKDKAELLKGLGIFNK